MMDDRDELIERLYEAHYHSIFRYCSVFVQNASQHQDLIEDCVQEAFVRAIIHRDKLETLHNPAGWIALTARNLLRDALQKSRNGMTASTRYAELLNERTHPWEQPIEKKLRHDELVNCLTSIYGELTEMEKKIFRAYFLDNLSLKETADFLHMSFNSIRSGVERIRMRAKKYKNLVTLFLIAVILCVKSS